MKLPYVKTSKPYLTLTQRDIKMRTLTRRSYKGKCQLVLIQLSNGN